jgi:hypothetical protein
MIDDQLKTHDQTRPRSPGYPAIDLKTALDRARALHKFEGKNRAPVGTILEHWGHKPTSGAGMVTVAAMKKFGLLETEGSGPSRKGRLTEEALRILLDEREPSSERDALVRSAALKPAIYSEIWAKYSSGMPSDANLKHELVWERGFTPGGAAEFLGPFHRTVAFAGLTDGDGASDDGSSQQAEDADNEIRSDEGQTDVLGGGIGPTLPRRDPASREVQLPVALDEWATLRAIFPLTEAKWAQMLAVLQAMKPALVLDDPPD